MYQQESAMGTHTSPPSWISLPSSTQSHSRSSQSTRLELPASYNKFPLVIYFTCLCLNGNIYVLMVTYMGFPDSSVGKESVCNAEDPSSINPWVGKIPWRRERLPTPVFWPFQCYFPNLSHPLLPPLCSKSVRMSLSTLLPCVWVHQYHKEGFSINYFIWNTFLILFQSYRKMKKKFDNTFSLLRKRRSFR